METVELKRISNYFRPLHYNGTEISSIIFYKYGHETLKINWGWFETKFGDSLSVTIVKPVKSNKLNLYRTDNFLIKENKKHNLYIYDNGIVTFVESKVTKYEFSTVTSSIFSVKLDVEFEKARVNEFKVEAVVSREENDVAIEYQRIVDKLSKIFYTNQLSRIYVKKFLEEFKEIEKTS